MVDEKFGACPIRSEALNLASPLRTSALQERPVHEQLPEFSRQELLERLIREPIRKKRIGFEGHVLFASDRTHLLDHLGLMSES